VYEEDGIRAFIPPGHSLGQASNFISVRVCPDCFCLGVADQMPKLEVFALSPRTELAISQSHVIGILRDDDCFAAISKTGFLVLV